MLDDLFEQRCRRVQNVLAVVDDKKKLARPQVLDHGLLDAETLLLLQPQSRRDGVAHRLTGIERREFAYPYAVSEAFLVAPCGLECEPGLSDTADPGQRHQRALTERGGYPLHLLVAADEAGRAPRQIDYGRTVECSHHPRRNLVVAVENLLMHLTQRRPGIDAELLDESFAHLPVGVERVGLSAAAILGEHQLPGQAFVQWVGV